jgi:dTDP-4-dehydrorhamnose reductase
MPRLLVTGGTGYLGSELIQQAAASGWELVATAHAGSVRPPQARWITLDLRDAANAQRQLAALQPDVIIHTAYVQSGPDMHAITALGAGAVAAAARSVGARLIHMSTDVVFDGELGRPYAEDDPQSPISAYGQAKADSERLVAEAHPEALVVRTSLIYGGEVPSKHEQVMLEAADGRAEFAFYSDELRCPIQVGDLAAALLELLSIPVWPRMLHIAGADSVSRIAFARLVAARGGRSTAGLREALSPGIAGGRPRNCALDTARAQALLRTRLRGATEVLRN